MEPFMSAIILKEILNRKKMEVFVLLTWRNPEVLNFLEYSKLLRNNGDL